MKSESEIRSRLKKLRIEYAKQYINKSQSKIPENCVFNYKLTPVPRSKEIDVEYERAPRINRTLVVIQDDSNIRICTYGSNDPTQWSGDKICDSIAVSESCPWFEAKLSRESSIKEFQELISDDEYVHKLYKDISTLQWVLDERIYQSKLSILDKIKLFFIKRKKNDLLLQEQNEQEGIEEIWDNSNDS